MKTAQYTKILTKDVAIFENNDLVGFEEIMRQYINQRLQNEDDSSIDKESQIDNPKREFTLVSNSVLTEVLFINQSLIMPVIRV